MTVAEAAYLGAIPKGPSNYHPVNHHDRAVEFGEARGHQPDESRHDDFEQHGDQDQYRQKGGEHLVGKSLGILEAGFGRRARGSRG